ncbi:hypothetical protein [uncultured Cellulomonas sp.]|uniref:hypothetical protein n=1 Tax=uncultured Cellulomonas sp. TaxID=189682 RepID=UPI00261B8B59|nr:hypothetical protein [uncultured Cellulomonas sp.]
MAAALVLLGGAAVAQGMLRTQAPPAAEPEVVVLPSPTPTLAPVERAPVSAFADVLPSAVLSFALTGLTEETPLVAAGALEAYRLEYSDGGGGGVTVIAAQWRTPDDAREAAARVVPDGGAGTVDDGRPTSGDVTVAGAPAGTWALASGADGTAVLVWSNGTATFQVAGPLAAVRDVHAAYPY